MNIKIAIIHDSVIIRKGLESLIKEFWKHEVVLESSIPELIQSNDFNSTKFILICSPEVFHKTDFSEISEIQEALIIYTDQNVKQQEGENPGLSVYSGISEIKESILKISSQFPDNTTGHEGEDLTPREKDILRLVALGFSNKEIAGKLFISIHTVISHRKNITEKLGIKSISGLTVYAIISGLIDTNEISPEELI